MQESPLLTRRAERRMHDAVDDELPSLVAVHAHRRRIDVAKAIEGERTEDAVFDPCREELLDDRRTRSAVVAPTA